MSAARNCKSEKTFWWLNRRGANWRAAADEAGLGFEHWAALSANACALKFWRDLRLGVGRRDRLGWTAFERSMASPGWGAELMLRLWPKELGVEHTRSALYKAGEKVGQWLDATQFARSVGLVCRERPEAIAPDRRLSRLWGALFPGPIVTPRRMLEELENQSLARFEAKELLREIEKEGGVVSKRAVGGEWL